MREHVFHLEKKSLKRVLGVSDLFAIGYGDVGSSIYYALGATALFALGATPIALLIAGLFFFCTCYTYAEMAAAFPEPGGSATFSRNAFNDLISFVAGWSLLLDYIVSIAIAVFAIPPYLRYVIGVLHIPLPDTGLVHLGFSTLIILALLIVNILGTRGSGRLNFYLSLITVLSQAFVILVGALLALNLPYVWSQMKIADPMSMNSPDWWNFMKGVAMAMVAYTGIEAITQMAAEAKHPSITIPKAIRWTMFILVFLYLGIATVGLSVIVPQELGTTYLEDPIAGIVSKLPIGGALLAPWFGLIAALLLLVAANAGLLGCSRLTFSMGRYYQLPNFFYRLHAKFRTPHVSLTVFSLAAIAVIWASRGQMLFLADLYNFGAQIAFFAAHMSLIVLRYKKPELTRPFRAPLNIPIGRSRTIPLTAVIGALGTFATWCLVVLTKPEGRILGFSWIILGVAMYYYYRRSKELRVTGQLKVSHVKVPEYRPVEHKHILVAARASQETEALQIAFQLAKIHQSKITVVYVLEVPSALPMDAPMGDKEALAEAALQKASAVAGEFHLTPHVELIRSRSIASALERLGESGEFDLVVLGVGGKQDTHFWHEAEQVFRSSRTRVLFCGRP
ncbi:MAG: hypothetical protein RL235_536 [Chlamydiota bacterium]|jgi:APA family basic amino acid/polyamine antiporter